MLTRANVIRFAESFTGLELPEIHEDRVARLLSVLRAMILYYGADQPRNHPCLEVSETCRLLRIRVTAIPVKAGPVAGKIRVLEESSWLHKEDPHVIEVLLQMLVRLGNALVPEDERTRRIQTPVSWVTTDHGDPEADGVAATEDGAGAGTAPRSGGLRPPTGLV